MYIKLLKSLDTIVSHWKIWHLVVCSFQMKVQIQNQIQIIRNIWLVNPTLSLVTQAARYPITCQDWIYRIQSSWQNLHGLVTSWKCESHQWWTAWSAQLLVRTRAARKCFGTIARCASICTLMAREYTCALNAVKLSLRVPNSRGISWYIRARNHFNVRSKVAVKGSVWTSIYAPTWEFIQVTDRTFARSTDVARNSRNRRTSSRIYWRTLRQSKFTVHRSLCVEGFSRK